MKTKENLPALSGKEANEALAMGDKNYGKVSSKEAFDIMDKAKDAELAEMTADYFEFKKAGTYNFLFLGIEKMRVEDLNSKGDIKEIDVVRLQDREGQLWIYGGAVVVNSLRKVNQLPCYVRLVYEGDVKGGSGSYKKFRVMTFKA